MTEDKIINFPITSPEQYKAYLKAEETKMMKIAGKLGYIYGTIYAFFDCLKIGAEVSIRHFLTAICTLLLPTIHVISFYSRPSMA